ncbi:MAG: hypothetical protein AAGC44_13810 [Planctomycetota bacterium]
MMLVCFTVTLIGCAQTSQLMPLATYGMDGRFETTFNEDWDRAQIDCTFDEIAEGRYMISYAVAVLPGPETRRVALVSDSPQPFGRESFPLTASFDASQDDELDEIVSWWLEYEIT